MSLFIQALKDQYNKLTGGSFDNVRKDSKAPRLKVFSVYDSKAKVFNIPFLFPIAALAVRGFTSAVSDPRSSLNKFPDDFVLFEIGEFDDVSGHFENYREARPVVTARELFNALPVTESAGAEKGNSNETK